MGVLKAWDGTDWRKIGCGGSSLGTETFDYNGTTDYRGGGADGSDQEFVVPDGVTTLTVELWGAEGGDYGSSTVAVGGLGGYLKTELAVTPGETLILRVGGKGLSGMVTGGSMPGGYNLGGSAYSGAGGADDNGTAGSGGGATTILRGSTILAAAGGGGGSGGDSSNGGPGGAGGDTTGQAGFAAAGGSPTGGAGGTSTQSSGQGGNSSGSVSYFAGGGGGGGWDGGQVGNGSSSQGAGGGGGSSGSSGTVVTNTRGVQSSHGQAALSWTAAGRLRLWTGTEWVREVCDDDGFSYSDDFTRADSTTTLGSPWTVGGVGGSGAPVWGIASNKAYCVSGDGAALIDTGQTSYTITATLSGTPDPFGSDFGFVVRYVDTNNQLFISVNALAQYVAGSFSTVYTAASSLHPGDVVVVDVTPTTITATRNGSAWISASNSSLSTATKAGMWGSHAFTPNGRHDDFSITAGPERHPLKIEDPANPGTWITVACFTPV